MSNQFQINNIKKTSSLDPVETELILAFILAKPREFIIAHPEYEVNKKQITRYKRLTNQRKKGVPLAYLTGHKEFYGLDFVVNKNVLIPRADTEMMVEEVIKEINRNKEITKKETGKYDGNREIILIDVGTGSGCIPIAVLKTIQQKIGILPKGRLTWVESFVSKQTLHANDLPFGRTPSKYINTFAIDISKNALKVARLNAKKHDVKIKFLHGNLLTPLSTFHFPLSSSIIITANLPYLSEQQYRSEPSIKFEPKKALVAKKNGLALYEKLLKQISKSAFAPPSLKTTDGHSKATADKAIFLEIDPSQTKFITKLIHQYLPSTNVEIKTDLAGRDRLVKITC